MIILNTLRFHIVGIVFNQLQREPMENQGSCSHQIDHDTGLNDYLSINHCPISIPDDSFFTLIDFVESNDLHGLSFPHSDVYRIVEAL